MEREIEWSFGGRIRRVDGLRASSVCVRLERVPLLLFSRARQICARWLVPKQMLKALTLTLTKKRHVSLAPSVTNANPSCQGSSDGLQEAAAAVKVAFPVMAPL